MRLTPRPRRESRLNLRATGRQKQLFESAAARRGMTVTQFILQSAEDRAEEVLAEEQDFVLPPQEWRAFVAALDRPVQPKPRLRRLLHGRSVLDPE